MNVTSKISFINKYFIKYTQSIKISLFSQIYNLFLGFNILLIHFFKNFPNLCNIA